MNIHIWTGILLALLWTGSVQAQGLSGARPSSAVGGTPATPEPFEILSLRVDGVDNPTMASFVMRASGLSVGQSVILPGDEAIGKGIRSLYRLGSFSEVEVLAEKYVGKGVFLIIRVKEEPRLEEYSFTGIKKGDQSDLRKTIPLLRGRAVRPGDLERARRVIQEFYAEKGFRRAEVDIQEELLANGGKKVTFVVKKNELVQVGHVNVLGNDQFSDRKIRKKLKVKEHRWWRIFGKETFEEDKYKEGKQALLDFYNEKGFYDARIVSDSVYYATNEDGKEEIILDVTVAEGPLYYIRNIEWEGNTEYTDEQLTAALGLQKGDLYNRTKLERNVFGNPQSTDIRGLHQNIGYMLFQIDPTITEAAGDSLDLLFSIAEGDTYEFGDIQVFGNTKTKEHVIRRELRTIPGERFSRDAIERSVRELQQLNYFNVESLVQGPQTRINQANKTVDMVWSLEETGGDQLEFSGGWGGGSIGLILQVGVTFNNFSLQNIFKKDAWRPLPSGDGQRLSLRAQIGGSSFQQYSLSFQEPWFRGKPRPIGFSLSHTRQDYTRRFSQIVSLTDSVGLGSYSISSASVFYSQRLRWPDDFFQTSSSIGFRLYNINGSNLASRFGLPEGASPALTLSQSLVRNSFDNPIFPSSGSSLRLSLEIAPPISEFVQYHKWGLGYSWNLPLRRGKGSIGFSADYGYLGSINGDQVTFERYLIGGTPLQAQNFLVGSDLIFMRGYPIASIAPRSTTGNVVGGTILNKYTAEMRWLVIQSPQFQLQPYLFFDAANTWNGFDNYDPTGLYRAAGFGTRIFLPILGMLELSYGYNFDDFQASSSDAGSRRWRFQFTIGQGFGN